MTLRVSFAETHRTLLTPAENAHQRWTERAACILTLEGDSGTRGVGEASPLPGFSPDRLDSCVRALAEFDPSGIPTRVAAGHATLGELRRASQRLPKGVPAARAALEGALLDLWSREAGLPAWALLLEVGQNQPAARAIAALLMGEPEAALAQAKAAELRGARTFKFKIGRPGALERELDTVRSLRAELGDSARLRLDANQSFSVPRARTCLPQFAAHGLEFIEEPCSPGEIGLIADLRVPLAFDESLPWFANAPDQLATLGARALVLKPTLLGGISACAEWAERAHQLGAEVVISHAFEGPAGLALCAALALSLGSASAAHGLDLSFARLAESRVAGISGAELHPWQKPGWGTTEADP